MDYRHLGKFSREQRLFNLGHIPINQEENLKELIILFISVILVIMINICLIILLNCTVRKNKQPKHLVHPSPQVIIITVQFKGLRSELLSALNASI